MIALPGPPLILASASPQRRELLRVAGYRAQVREPHIDETPGPDEPPWELVLRLARAKCEAVGAPPDAVVIGADTIIVVDGEIFGKPRDDEHARRMLTRLAARQHQVVTGLCVRRGSRERAGLIASSVTFEALSPADIDAYIATGEPRGKAGAYAIQGRGAELVARVVGSYTNVVGLPMDEVGAAIEELTGAS